MKTNKIALFIVIGLPIAASISFVQQQGDKRSVMMLLLNCLPLFLVITNYLFKFLYYFITETKLKKRLDFMHDNKHHFDNPFDPNSKIVLTQFFTKFIGYCPDDPGEIKYILNGCKSPTRMLSHLKNGRSLVKFKHRYSPVDENEDLGKSRFLYMIGFIGAFMVGGYLTVISLFREEYLGNAIAMGLTFVGIAGLIASILLLMITYNYNSAIYLVDEKELVT